MAAVIAVPVLLVEHRRQPYVTGHADFRAALGASPWLGAGDTALETSLTQQAQQDVVWPRSAQAQIGTLTQTGRRATVADAVEGKASADAFRALNSIYAAQLASPRNQALRRATWLSVGVAVLLSLPLVAVGIAITRWIEQRERGRDRDRAGFHDINPRVLDAVT
jgi:hypothetical protein